MENCFVRALGTIALVAAAAVVVGSCDGADYGRYGGSDDESAKAQPVEVLTEHFDSEIPITMERFSIPGVSVALVDEGEVVWSKAYGTAHAAGNRPMTLDAVYRAESISKSVTAWAVMRLVEEGRIDLAAPVHTYIDGWELSASEVEAEAVTVRRLLSNTAGLPQGPVGPESEYEPGAPTPSLREYLDREGRFFQAPGEGFHYSNVGFAVLELLIEEVTGQEFASYMEGEILAPLGMEDSAFGWEERLGDRIPTAYEIDGDSVSPYTYAVQASGGLLATVADIARFASAGMTDEFYRDRGVLTEESMNLLYEQQAEIPGMFGVVADGYGLGHFLEQLPSGHVAAWHGGQGHGWMTHFHAVPEAGDAIVVFTNSARSWPFMAQVLGDWAEWSGHGDVKYGNITTANTVFDGLVGLATLGVIILLITFVLDLRRNARRFAPLAQTRRPRRITLAAVAVAIVAALGWAALQPYLFVTSIFPGSYAWAAYVLLAVAVTFLLFAAFPRESTTGRER
jgi:CubicO group peptidase (beta-lactamase class C family)